MPRIQLSASTTTPSVTLSCETTTEIPVAAIVPRASITTTTTTTNKTFGFGEGVCTCARCMRRAGPIREDVEERIVQIAYVLAGVYMDTPNPEEHVKEHHRQKAAEFMTMVEEGDLAGLRSLFDSVGSSEDTVVEEIATELIISAAQLGQADIIKLLKERGADVEEKDLRRGGRPLMHAANNGHTAAVKALLDGGADTEARDDNGYTALMVSIFSDRSSSAEALLAAGGQVDAVDDKGRTAMSYAAMYGSTDCIYLLSNHGANVFLADKEGNAPLELAEDSGRTQAMEALRKLQMKHKMQERRRHRQKSQGCLELNAVELKQKEAEAAAVAQQLLLELEEEEARKQAKSSKKAKKKGKAKHLAEEQQQQKEQQKEQQKQQQQRHTDSTVAALSHPSTATNHNPAPQSDPPHSRPSPHAPPTQPSLASTTSSSAPSPPPNPSAPQLDSVLTHKLPPASSPSDPPTVSSSPVSPIPASSEVDVDALRRRWEEVVEEGAKCLDPARQPRLLEAAEALQPLCEEHGISVKYGRKVVLRLRGVGPAREALEAALARKPVVRCELEAALKQARLARSLLVPGMVEGAEALLVRLKAEEQEKAWSNLASTISWDRTSSGALSGAGSPHAGAGAAFARTGSRMSTQASGLLELEGDIDAEQECVVCLSAVKNVCCVPCGHVCMCQACAEGVQAANGACPVCRGEIKCVIEILDEH